MKRKDLADFLKKLTEMVESGDSAEGSLSYLLGESYDDLEVECSVRVGNLDGQGGMVIL